MLDHEHRLCVIDLAGSALKGQEPLAIESMRYFLPRAWEEPSTVRTDIFALGSVIYAIFSGQAPYKDKTNEEVTALYTEGVFPPTDMFVGGEVITQCWTGVIVSADQAHHALSELLT